MINGSTYKFREQYLPTEIAAEVFLRVHTTLLLGWISFREDTQPTLDLWRERRIPNTSAEKLLELWVYESLTDDFFWNVLRDKHPSEPLSQNNSLLLSNEINGILTCGQYISKEMILAGGLQETARSGMFFWIIFSCSGFESLRSLNVVNKFFDIWNIWWHWSIKHRSWKISNKLHWSIKKGAEN